MKCKRVVVTARGGPETMCVVEDDLNDPGRGEVLVKILACAVCLPDVQARYGLSPFAPKPPFTPGYSIVGEVLAVGPGVSRAVTGQRVAAMTVAGGYAEYLLIKAAQLIPLPPGLDPAEAVPLVLNYIVAYQSMHGWARACRGETALIIGASGGIGTAFLQLGRLAGLKMYGVASGSKRSVIEEYGGTPIDYRTQDVCEVVRRAEPGGIDVIFDGMDGADLWRAGKLLRRSGRYIGYGNPLGFSKMLRLFGRLALFNLALNGKSAVWYSTGVSLFNRQKYLADWARLFEMLGAGQIRPVIAKTFPLLEAAEANRLLESGQVIGNVVLVAPDGV